MLICNVMSEGVCLVWSRGATRSEGERGTIPKCQIGWSNFEHSPLGWVIYVYIKSNLVRVSQI